MLSTLAPPRPSASGTNAPPMDVKTTAMAKALEGLIFFAATNFEVCRTDCIKITATPPKKGPKSKAINNNQEKSPSKTLSSKSFAPGQKISPAPAATQLAIAIGAIARNEKCRKIAS